MGSYLRLSCPGPRSAVSWPATAHFLFHVSPPHSFRFLKLPHNSRNPPLEHAELPVDTQDGDFEDISPPHEFSEDHFEVSPDHASPESPS